MMVPISSLDGTLDKDKKLCAPELEDGSQSLNHHIVDIFVGREKKRFPLHRDLLCERSDYFKACLAENSKEARKKKKKHFLSEDDTKSFDLFVEWLYGGRLKTIKSNDDLPIYLSLIILASKLRLEYFRNITMDRILRFNRKHPSPISTHSLRYIYQNTTDHDKIRRYIFGLAVVSDHRLTAHGEDLIRQGGDLAVYYTKWLTAFYAASSDAALLAKKDSRRVSNCYWHEHKTTPVCEDPAK